MKIWKRVFAFLFCFIISCFYFSIPAFALDLPEGKTTTDISFSCEGEGVPSLDNIRNIVGCDSAVLSFSNEEGDVVYSLPLPETVYGGTYDWATGVLTVTHKMFALDVANMNVAEAIPGWVNVEGLTECFAVGFSSTVQCTSNYIRYVAPNLVGKNRMIYADIRKTYKLTQSEWKALHPDLICQFVFPLLEPRAIQLSLCSDHTWNVLEQTDSTCAAFGRSVQTCSACGLTKTVVPPLSEHTWQETGRTDSTFDSLGSVTYTCSVCGETKEETLAFLPSPAESMSTLLSVIFDVFALFVSFISTLAVLFVSNPVLLVAVVFGFISIGIFLYRCILRL